MTIRDCTVQDAESICAIYNHYVENTIVTFDEAAWDAARMASWVETVVRTHPWIVLIEADRLVGYAYATQWKPKCAYRTTVEATVYLAPDCTGRGLGMRLYRTLLERLKADGIHAVVGGISLPNEPSVRLHEKLGFEKVAEFKELGKKFNEWIDVGYWQLRLEP